MYRSSEIICTFKKKRQKKPQNKKIHLIKFMQRTKCTAKAFKVNGKGMLWVLFVTGGTGFFLFFAANETNSFHFTVHVTQLTGKSHRRWMSLVRLILIKAVDISRQPSELM